MGKRAAGIIADIERLIDGVIASHYERL